MGKATHGVVIRLTVGLGAVLEVAVELEVPRMDETGKYGRRAPEGPV